MVKIYFRNNICIIIGLEGQIKYSLQKELSFDNLKHNFINSKYDVSKVKLLNLKTKTFPSGLLSQTCRFLTNNNVPFQIIDERIKPPESKIFYIKKNLPSRRPFQDYCLKLTETYDRGTFSLPTGTGKSRIAYELPNLKGQNTVFIVPSKFLVSKTTEDLTAFYGKHRVGDIKSEKDLIVTNFHALKGVSEDFYKNYPMLVLDEAHHGACDSIYNPNMDSWKYFYYKYHFTATDFRNDNSDLKMRGVIGDTIFRYTIPQAIKDGWIAKPYFFLYHVNNAGFYSESDFRKEYEQCIVNSEERNNKIQYIAMNLANKGYQVLILVKEIAHGELLSHMVPNSVFIKGETQKSKIKANFQLIKDFDNKKFPILIATPVLNEGMDIVSVNSIINAGGYKAKSEVVQKIGRTLRIQKDKSFSVVVDFFDNNTDYLFKHSCERISYYKEYESEIKIFQ